MPTITFTIPTGNIPETKAAVDHHVGGESTEEWTNQDYLDWIKARVRAQVKQLVLKYRESQVAAIDSTDPTTD